MESETYFDEYQRKAKAYDAQIDREWAQFPAWDDMTDEQKEAAIVFGVRQGTKQKGLLDSYHRMTGVGNGRS